MIRPSILVALLVLTPGLSQAEVYRWVDEHGDVHYSDRRPPHAADTIDVDTAPQTDAPAASDRNRQVENALRIVTDSREHREELQRERDEATAERQQRQLECQQLARYRDRIAAGGFLYRRNDEERKALSDEEIAAELSKLNRNYDENCTAQR